MSQRQSHEIAALWLACAFLSGCSTTTTTMLISCPTEPEITADAFILKRPECWQRYESNQGLMRLRFKQAESASTTTEYQRFINHYPSGEMTVLAYGRIDDINFAYFTKRKGTIEAHEDFIRFYPESRNKKAAEEALSKLNANLLQFQAELTRILPKREEFAISRENFPKYVRLSFNISENYSPDSRSSTLPRECDDQEALYKCVRLRIAAIVRKIASAPKLPPVETIGFSITSGADRMRYETIRGSEVIALYRVDMSYSDIYSKITANSADDEIFSFWKLRGDSIPNIGIRRK